MQELNFDSGIVTYNVNGKCEISLNPTDMAFAEKLFAVFAALDEKQERYREAAKKIADNKEMFVFCRTADAEMRELVNSVFDRDVCTPLFGGMNVYALASGLPVWANFLLSIMDIVDVTFAKEQKAINPRVNKYIQKYHK